LSTSSGKVLLIRILNSFSPTHLPVISASLIQTLIRTWSCDAVCHNTATTVTAVHLYLLVHFANAGAISLN